MSTEAVHVTVQSSDGEPSTVVTVPIPQSIQDAYDEAGHEIGVQVTVAFGYNAGTGDGLAVVRSGRTTFKHRLGESKPMVVTPLQHDDVHARDNDDRRD